MHRWVDHRMFEVGHPTVTPGMAKSRTGGSSIRRGRHAASLLIAVMTLLALSGCLTPQEISSGKLWDAARDGDTDAAVLLVEAGVVDVESISTAVFKAAQEGHFDTAVTLIEAGIAMSTDDDSAARRIRRAADSALRMAGRYGHSDAVKPLVGVGAGVYDGFLAAVSNGHTDTVVAYMEAGAGVSDSAIQTALEEGFTDTALALIKGAELDVDGVQTGRYPRRHLHVAAGKGYTDVVVALLEAGVSPGFGMMAAAERGDFEMVSLLLQAGAHPSEGLKAAAEQGDTEMMSFLLEAGADLASREGGRALSGAINSGRSEMVAFLLGAGVDPKYGLVAAAYRGDKQTVKALIKARTGVPDDSYLSEAGSALHVAARRGDIDMMAAMLGEGADPNARKRYGGYEGLTASPLHAAAWNGQTGAVRTLIEAGAILNVRARHARSSENELAEVVTLLIPPLFLLELLSPLVRPSPSIDGVRLDLSRHGWTPLQFAADGGHTGVLTALIEAGADTSVL